MPLLKTISGMRGTVGGAVGTGLTPIDITSVVSVYGMKLATKNPSDCSVVVGRDGRTGGEAIQHIVMGVLRMCGVRVIDVGYSTTPTVSYVTCYSTYQGGIIITASHNSKEWNALKFIDDKGELFAGDEMASLYAASASDALLFPNVDGLGEYVHRSDAMRTHIDGSIAYELTEVEKIRSRKFKIVADVINSTGALALKMLFDALDITYILLNDTIDGNFAHDPEPIEEHLTKLRQQVIQHNADLGIAVDPDVDRLCFVTEHGEMFGEEYTLVAVADYVLQSMQEGCAVVSNLSSSQSLADLATVHGASCYSSKVGEAHVVSEMKKRGAVIGGEGNGGVIVSNFHYGRDAIIGICLFLSYLSKEQVSCSSLRRRYPTYVMKKDKMLLERRANLSQLEERVMKDYPSVSVDSSDGVKIIFPEKAWVHVRQSNTEPILRILAESLSDHTNDSLIQYVKNNV